MARRRRRSQISVSLFPFLSVLACVIGALTLLIAALAVGQVAADLRTDVDPAARGAAAAPLGLATLEARLAAARAELDELERLRRALRALGIEPAAADTLRGAVTKRVARARLGQRLAALRHEREELDAAIRFANAKLDWARELRDRAATSILPSGAGLPLRPFFVECGGDGARIFEDGRGWSRALRLDDIADRTRFTAFLQSSRVERHGTIIFLIREDGIATYRTALRRAEQQFVRHAKLPIPGRGPIDFAAN